MILFAPVPTLGYVPCPKARRVNVTRNCTEEEKRSKDSKEARQNEADRLYKYESFYDPVEFAEAIALNKKERDQARQDLADGKIAKMPPEETYSGTTMLKQVKNIEQSFDLWKFKGRFVVLGNKIIRVSVGKVVASAALIPIEEWPLIDGNPSYEFYEFGYIDDVRTLVQNDNLVAINNALMVDLTGQVASETIGPLVWTGVGGQTAFAIAANYSNGGRSVTVLPSSHMINGDRVSRIVPALPEAAVVTVPRTLVDYVVTENGIATLRGKTTKQRMGELIAVAHPDLQSELRREARNLYGFDA